MVKEFRLKICIAKEGISDESKKNGVRNVKKMFKPSSKLLSELEALKDIKFEVSDIDHQSDIDHDYIRLKEHTKNISSEDETFIIYCKSTTISSVSADEIIKTIYYLYTRYNNSEEEKFDSFYLCKWADRCDQFTNIEELDNGTKLVETTKPHGLQCVLFSPSGIKKIKDLLKKPCNIPFSMILTNLITHGKMKALACTPNIANFDVTAATNSNDYIKSHECTTIPTETHRSNRRGSNMSLFVFIVIATVVMLVFYFMCKFIYKPINFDTSYTPPDYLIAGE
jgi:hypothetical protein